jgi:ribonucleoside-diphosphate reductase alpha chain
MEIFISVGKSGQFLNNFCEALGRTISISLQHGVPVEAIYKTLVGINSDRVTWFRFEETDKKPTQLLSIPDAIAQLFKRYYMDKDNVSLDTVQEQTGEMCSKCGSMSVVKIEGCSICTSCSESKCG